MTAMAIHQQNSAFSIKFQQVDGNYYSHYDNNDNNNHNVTFNRIFSKFGDIVAPKSMRNLQNIAFSFPEDPLKLSSVNIHSLSEQIEFLNSTSSIDENDDVMSSVCLAQSIENSIKDVKPEELGEGGELVVPADLSRRVAEDIVRLAEDEPCGLRGCIIYINIETKAPTGSHRLGKVKCDSTAVPTFEVTLNLKQDSGWLRLLPLKGYWKKLKNKSVIISSCYSLTKNKLYRSDQQL